MQALDLEDATARKLNIIEKKAIDVIGSVLDGADQPEYKTKLAVQTLTIIEKNRRDLTVREATRFQMANRIFNKEQLKKYVHSTQPEIKRLSGD